jgi:hypothetical protein
LRVIAAAPYSLARWTRGLGHGARVCAVFASTSFVFVDGRRSMTFRNGIPTIPDAVVCFGIRNAQLGLIIHSAERLTRTRDAACSGAADGPVQSSPAPTRR